MRQKVKNFSLEGLPQMKSSRVEADQTAVFGLQSIVFVAITFSGSLQVPVTVSG